MSRSEFKGATYAFAKWMQEAADEIARGDRKGADRKWKRAHPKIRTVQSWWREQTRKRA